MRSDGEDARDDEHRLLARVAAGDRRAFGELLDRHLPGVVALAERLLGVRQDAEEVAQETFLALWRKAPSWRRDGPALAAWLRRVAVLQCRRRRRAARGRPPTVALEEVTLADDRASPERVAESAALARRLAAALARLPARQREALVLRYDQELAMSEIAEILGIGEHALESLLARARRALKRALGEGP